MKKLSTYFVLVSTVILLATPAIALLKVEGNYSIFAKGTGMGIGIEMPIKVDLRVTDAPPAVRGDTSKGGNKQITLETGAIINGPLFINEGDILRINTETGEYVERANK